MKGNDEIKDLFSDKLSGYEAKVNPELWTNISANIGSTSAIATTGLTAVTKIIIGLSIFAAAVTGVVLLTNEPSTKDKKVTQTEVSIVENDTNKEELNNDTVEPTIGLSRTVSDQSATNVVEREDIVEEVLINKEEDQDHNNAQNTPLNEQGGILVKEDDPLNEIINEEVQHVIVSEHIESNIPDETEVIEENDAVESIEEVKNKLVLSNIFSPNNDMNNDFLFVESEGLSDFNVVVLNAQNKVVYQSNDPNFQWNGIGMDGAPVDSGNYVYFVTARDENGNPVNQHSPLTIVR